MKKLIALCAFCALCLAQVKVSAQCVGNDTYWKVGFNGSFKIADCNNSQIYNCHGFTMSYFEKGGSDNPCNPTPFYYIGSSYQCPATAQGVKTTNQWQGTPRYVQVCNEADANIAFYTGSSSALGGDHSAVQIGQFNGVYKYMSKYGQEGPLVQHDLNGSWYHNDNTGANRVTGTAFWKFVGEIVGEGQLIGTGNQTYSVINGTGLSYSWSIISGGEHIYISSSSTANSVTLTPLHSGNAVLRVSVSSGCGVVKTQDKALTIQTNICLEGTFQNNSSTNKNLNNSNSVAAGWVNCTVTCPNAASYTFQRTSGTLSFYTSGNFLSFNITSGASVSFLVTARNSSNSSIGTRTITFYNFGSFRAFPNPASSSLTIDVAEDVPVTVTLQGSKQEKIKEIKQYNAKTGIDVSQLEEGEYVIKVYHQGKLMNEERVKIAH